ncbi:serine aminopeptidase domain-containing protein [Mucilaginibacter sp. SJ]|uniref:serine aminopeptidase domain-containing protein n=1 Tax=Mucilaginibacter sp. SJ TaxID=3029053 RepID=UPI0023AA08E8|nr:alpha/beta hydrolase [Mucilaginibacter sp. SJ]WEA01644.1 alpha/beta hydrolase [Mucilaginibacter sp. SJ]
MFCQFIPFQEGDLYSVYHEPEIMDHDDIGIVLCYPYGQEYIRCHRLYVNLANKLARRGFHVLRFDYYGTGDSSGDFTLVTVPESLNNIKIVIDQFKESCGVSRIVLFGVRFGASLAIMYSKIYSIDALVLWNPVLDGSAYLKEIDHSYKRWLNGSFTKEKNKSGSFMENFGFQFSDILVKEISGVCIEKGKLSENIPSLIFDVEDWQPDDNKGLLYEKSVNTEYWIKREDVLDKAIVPVHETEKTIEWLDKLVF